MTPLATIAALLRRHIGMDVSALGPRALALAVRGRTTALGLDGPAAYLEVLESDADEWQALLEVVVVPETWFFRDRQPFAFLGGWAAGEWRGRDSSDPVRLLSLPCASGEEAWSIAIVLAAIGLPADAFRIEAFDLSQRALDLARDATYAPRSLRGQSIEPAWARYLVARPDGRLEVAADLRPCVRFARGNVVDAPRLLAGQRFDCVFSRNLLIYCDEDTRAAAVASFTAALRPGGLLFLGHAESLPAKTPGLVRAGPPGAFAYRRIDAAPQPAPRPRRAAVRATMPPPRKTRRASAHAAPPPGDDLPLARALADAGRLSEAAEIASRRLQRLPGEAATQALLGVVRAAQGLDRDAADHLRRALYLDPACEEALAHLPLVLERLGEPEAAERLRRRARRLGSGG